MLGLVADICLVLPRAKEILDILTDCFTIGGVVSAIWIYLQWRKDFKAQKAHNYAIDMLQKLYSLRGSVDVLLNSRSVKGAINGGSINRCS